MRRKASAGFGLCVGRVPVAYQWSALGVAPARYKGHIRFNPVQYKGPYWTSKQTHSTGRPWILRNAIQVNPTNPRRRSNTKLQGIYLYMYEGSIALFSLWRRLYTYIILAPTQNSVTFRSIPNISFDLPERSVDIAFYWFLHFLLSYKRWALRYLVPYFDLLLQSPSVSILRPLQIALSLLPPLTSNLTTIKSCKGTSVYSLTSPVSHYVYMYSPQSLYISDHTYTTLTSSQ
jgi:hypothetical protein